MECTGPLRPDNAEYLRSFTQKSAMLKVPLSGTLDLTHRCNLRCVHCYLGDRRQEGRQEMDTGRILSLIDEFTEAGCLYLLITGGEPLLRKDFPVIYGHAKTAGLLVTVFTNGTLLTDRETNFFDNLPPRAVEISVYGSTAATYEKITGTPGSFDKCLSGITRLLDSGINVTIKTVLMKQNSHEFSGIEKMASDLGAKFRFDAALFPCLDGDKGPAGLRVHPSEAVEKEFSDLKRASHWKKFLAAHRGRSGSGSESLYRCSAGVTGFYVGPSGSLSPCLMPTGMSHDLAEGGFASGWKIITALISVKKADMRSSCYRCEKILLCGYCPAFFNLENGSEDMPSTYLCEIGGRRHQHLKNIKQEGALYAG